VFVNEEENRIEDVRALEKAGVEVDVTFPRTVSEVPGAIRRWGNRMGEGSEGEAETLALRIEDEERALKAESPGAPFLYAYWIWKDPWMTISDDTYVADLLRLAGGVNVFGREADRYPATTPEASLERGADVHFFPSEPYPFRREKHEPLSEQLFGKERVRLFVEGDDYCWHGVRTLDGLKSMRLLRKRLEAER
jgi:ABC-type Fe3+-hydroxamate transport system substrate-binding protein